MKVICLRKSLTHGAIKLVRDQVSEDLPVALAQQWIAQGYARDAAVPVVTEAPKPTTRHRRNA